jgi:hypothetical protein
MVDSLLQGILDSWQIWMAVEKGQTKAPFPSCPEQCFFSGEERESVKGGRFLAGGANP